LGEEQAYSRIRARTRPDLPANGARTPTVGAMGAQQVSRALLAAAAVLSLGACGITTPAGAATRAPAAAPSAPAAGSLSVAPSQSAGPDTDPSDVPTPDTLDGYGQALALWRQGAVAASGQRGAYWLRAAADLQAGQDSDERDTSGYPDAIDALTDLASNPGPEQVTADIGALDDFFGTPGLYA